MDRGEDGHMDADEGAHMDASVKRNLADAGCSESLIDEFAMLTSQDERLRWLTHYRRGLIVGIREEQKKLDCLDYLIYSLRDHS